LKVRGPFNALERAEGGQILAQIDTLLIIGEFAWDFLVPQAIDKNHEALVVVINEDLYLV
jgi:hypothetical protein